MNTAQTPTTTIKDSGELAQGDIVITHGMRVRLDEGGSHQRGERTVSAWVGTVLNLDEVREAGHVPMSFLRTQKWAPSEGGWVTDREDVWHVQGNEFANWLVEDPS